VNTAFRSAPGSPNSSDGGILLEGVAANEAAVSIKNVRPMMSPAAAQRLVQLSNDLTVSRSAPVSSQGLTDSVPVNKIMYILNIVDSSVRTVALLQHSDHDE